MAGRLLTAPTWAHVLIQGISFAVLMFAVEWCSGVRSLTAAAVVAVIIGVIWGLTFGIGRGRWHRSVRAGLDLPRPQLRAAADAVVSGPVPPDQGVRRAAATLAQRQLERSRRNGPLGPVVMLVVAAAAAFNAASAEPRMWLLVGPFVAVAVYVWWLPRHLTARVALLGPA